MAGISAPSPTRTLGTLLPLIGKSDTKPTWCPGCGDFGVVAAVEMAVKRLQIPSHRRRHRLGDRMLLEPPALPLLLRLPRDPRPGAPGRGRDPVGEPRSDRHRDRRRRRRVRDRRGPLHPCDAAERRPDVRDDGQPGLRTHDGAGVAHVHDGPEDEVHPEGVIENPIDPIALALASGATYIARAFSGDVKQMADLVAGGIQHKGFAFIDALSPCVTYNKINTFDWFRQRVYKLESSGHDPSDIVPGVASRHRVGRQDPDRPDLQGRQPDVRGPRGGPLGRPARPAVGRHEGPRGPPRRVHLSPPDGSNGDGRSTANT